MKIAQVFVNIQVLRTIPCENDSDLCKYSYGVELYDVKMLLVCVNCPVLGNYSCENHI